MRTELIPIPQPITSASAMPAINPSAEPNTPRISLPPNPSNAALIQAAVQAARSEATIAATRAIQAAQGDLSAHADAILKSTEKRAGELLERVTALTKTSQVVVGIKVGDKPSVTLPNQHPKLAQLVSILANGENALLVGPAGAGKTSLSAQAARALALPFAHVCLTAGASETWLFGRQTPQGFIIGDFARLYRDGGVYLADEADAADSNLLLAINTALDNSHLFNPISGETYARHPDFKFIAAANTHGKGATSLYTGRSRLDAATLDRFVTLEISYLPEIENALCPILALADGIRDARDAIAGHSQEVISYRFFRKAHTLFLAGWEIPEIFASLTASWPEETRSQSGLMSLKVKDAPKPQSPTVTPQVTIDPFPVKATRPRGRPMGYSPKTKSYTAGKTGEIPVSKLLSEIKVQKAQEASTPCPF